jgi:beta-glucosidase
LSISGPAISAWVTEAGDIMVPAGRYTISIGGGQPGFGLPTVSGQFTVSGRVKLSE